MRSRPCGMRADTSANVLEPYIVSVLMGYFTASTSPSPRTSVAYVPGTQRDTQDSNRRRDGRRSPIAMGIERLFTTRPNADCACRVWAGFGFAGEGACPHLVARGSYARTDAGMPHLNVIASCYRLLLRTEWWESIAGYVSLLRARTVPRYRTRVSLIGMSRWFNTSARCTPRRFGVAMERRPIDPTGSAGRQ